MTAAPTPLVEPILSNPGRKILPFGKRSRDFALTPPEYDRRMTILEGAVRSAKTWTMLAKFLRLCAYRVAGLRLITGATKDSVYRNVLSDLFDLLGPKNYTYNRQSGELDVMGVKWVVMGAKDDGSERNIRGATVGIWYADELVLHPWNFVQMALNRMSSGGARMYATTNPDSPYHPVKTDILDKPEIQVDLTDLKFTLEDNPNLTAEYKSFLRRMYVGVYYLRFILGKWVVAEGSIYGSCWSEDLCYDGPCPVGEGMGEMTIPTDCGVGHPQVYHAVIDDGDTAWFDREYVWDSKKSMAQKTDGQYADDLQKFMKGEGIYDPLGNVCGHPGRSVANGLVLVPPECASFDAELTLRGIWHMDADHDVADGIRMVSSMMALKKIKFSRERCPRTIKRLPAYAWDEKKALRGIEEPIKVNDDECLIAGTLITTGRGDVPIESVCVGDFALTREGWSEVTGSALTKKSAKVFDLVLSDGRVLTGTANHPVFSDSGFISLDGLRYANIVQCLSTPYDSMDLSSDCTQEETTTPLTSPTGEKVQNLLCTERYGRKLTDLFQKAMRYITAKATKTTSVTSGACQREITPRSTASLERGTVRSQKSGHALKESGSSPSSGTAQKPVRSGIRNMALRYGKVLSRSLRNAFSVGPITRLCADGILIDSALIIASLPTVDHWALTTFRGHASSVKDRTKLTNTVRPNLVPLSVVGVYGRDLDVPVYNLTVEAGEYFANGILVHNCDSVRYFVKSRIGPWRIAGRAA